MTGNSAAHRSAEERRLIRIVLACLKCFLWLLPARTAPKRLGPQEQLTVLLTGTFHSANWAVAHLHPIAEALAGGRLTIVTTYPLLERPGLVVVQPPRWLRATSGDVGARLLMFAWTAVRERPDIVGGFHLLFNGMVAALVGRLVNAATMYFCVGGEAEVVGGGIRSENRLLGKLSAPEEAIERLLVDVVKRFDIIVTMGTGAAEFFRTRGIQGYLYRNGGGIDTRRFQPGRPADKDIDVLFVGRLAPIKRVDRLLDAVFSAKPSRHLKVVIVGAGECLAELESRSRELGIEACVTFAGQQADVGSFLRRSRVFALTSESEGVSLSMLEAMISGVVPVVSDVGDLGDVVQDGDSGFLVADLAPKTFAERFLTLLDDDAQLAAMSERAQQRAREFSLEASAVSWQSLFKTLR
jgi:L-malate glycosyltransferase